MSWWDGKSKVTALCVGESNMGGIGTPANYEMGLQTTNANCQYWQRPLSLPYAQTGHAWGTLNPDGPSRHAEVLSSFGGPLVKGDQLLYMGHMQGGHGNPAMAMCDVLQKGTGLPVQCIQGFAGGATSADWIDWLWTQLETQVEVAIAASATAITAMDVIYLSIGGGDVYYQTPTAEYMNALGPTWRFPWTPVTAQQYYENMRELRGRLIEKGWWVPGDTQIVLQDIPRSSIFTGYYPEWRGLEYVRTRFNDRIALINSTGASFETALPIHYTPQSYTDLGREAGGRVIEQIPKQASTLSIGGVPLAIGSSRLRVHS